MSKQQSTMIRVAVLVVVMVIAGGALAYDFLIARPAAQAAYTSASNLVNRDGTRDAVIAEIGSPDSSSTVGDGSVDVYHFRSGLFFRTYDVYVVYNGSGTIQRVTKDTVPPELN